MFSPDGRWLAYLSNESGVYQIYVQAFARKGGKRQVSTHGGTFPAWSRNRNDLFFMSLGADRQLLAASYRVHGDSFLPEAPHVYSRKIAVFGSTRSHDPAPDGKRVVVLAAADTARGSDERLVFLLNFFDELRRRVPLNAN
jgi:Tol biopolymer transport system component